MQIRCYFPDISYLSETQKNSFQFLNIYNIKTQESNPCIVIFYTVDLCTFRLVETVTELQNKYSEPDGNRNVLVLCTLENNKAIYFLCTSFLFSSGIADKINIFVKTSQTWCFCST